MAPQKYYTVGVSNKFAAFGADSDASSDEGEVILAAPPPAPTEQQQQLHQGPAANRKKEQQQQQPQLVSPQRERQGRPPRSARGGFGGEGRGAYRGSRGRPEGAAEVSEEYAGQLSPQEGDGGHRRRGGFRGARRGGAAAGAGGPMGRREFDRHSATGRGREMKKQGAGGHNWGQDEAENQMQKAESIGEELANKEEKQLEAEASEEQRENKEGTPTAQEAEPEEETIDLDTYKKLQAEKRANLPQFVTGTASSKAIETDKELAAQGYVRLERAVEGETEGSPEESPETRDDRPKKKSINLYEYVHIEGGRVPSFGRRGGGRGGRDDRQRRGGFRGAPRNREVAPDLKDTQAFPTLGAR